MMKAPIFSSEQHIQIFVGLHVNIWLESMLSMLEIIWDRKVFNLNFMAVISSHSKEGSKP